MYGLVPMSLASILTSYHNALPTRFGSRKGLPPGALSSTSNDKAAEGRKILLVDDNADLLDMVSVLFEERGLEVFTASSGAKALEILKQVRDIDAVVTDVVMPGMSGVELGHAARRLLPQIKIVLVSGYANPAAYAGHGDLHDFEFLKKPYRLEDVLQLLDKQD